MEKIYFKKYDNESLIFNLDVKYKVKHQTMPSNNSYNNIKTHYHS